MSFGETVKSTSVHYSAKMIVKVDDADDKDTKEGEFPEVPDEAIVKPEDERPVKMTKNPEEELPGEENKHDDEGIDDSTDMDGDGSPDLWANRDLLQSGQVLDAFKSSQIDASTNVIEIGPTFYGASLSASKRIEFAE